MLNATEDQRNTVISKIDEGIYYIDKEQYNASLLYFQEALKICNSFDKEKNDPITAMALIGIGTVNHANGNCREALKWYNEGLAIRESVYQDEARTDTAHLYKHLGLCNYAIGKYRESLSNFYKQRDMFEELEKSGQNYNSYIAEVYRNIGICYERLNNHERSLENYLIAMDKYKILYVLKNYPTDLPKYMESSYYQEINDYADSIRNVGAAYFMLEDDYHQSKLFFHQALVLKQSIYGETPRKDIISLYHDISLIYQELHDDKSYFNYRIKQLEMQLEIFEPVSQKELEEKANILDELAIAYQATGQHEQKVLFNYEQALFIRKNISIDHIDLIKSYSKLEEYYNNLNHTVESEDSATQLQQIIDKYNAELKSLTLDINESDPIDLPGDQYDLTMNDKISH